MPPSGLGEHYRECQRWISRLGRELQIAASAERRASALRGLALAMALLNSAHSILGAFNDSPSDALGGDCEDSAPPVD